MKSIGRIILLVVLSFGVLQGQAKVSDPAAGNKKESKKVKKPCTEVAKISGAGPRRVKRI